MLFEMRGTMAPVHTELVDQEAGNYVTGAHTHISSEQELFHSGVDKLFASTTILPSLQILLCPRPRPGVLVTCDTTQLEDPITLAPGNVNHAVPPF